MRQVLNLLIKKAAEISKLIVSFENTRISNLSDENLKICTHKNQLYRKCNKNKISQMKDC